jgi:hypothetical protein
MRAKGTGRHIQNSVLLDIPPVVSPFLSFSDLHISLDNRSDDGSKLRDQQGQKVRVDTFKIQDAAVNKAAEERRIR